MTSADAYVQRGILGEHERLVVTVGTSGTCVPVRVDLQSSNERICVSFESFSRDVDEFCFRWDSILERSSGGTLTLVDEVSKRRGRLELRMTNDRTITARVECSPVGEFDGVFTSQKLEASFRNFGILLPCEQLDQFELAQDLGIQAGIAGSLLGVPLWHPSEAAALAQSLSRHQSCRIACVDYFAPEKADWIESRYGTFSPNQPSSTQSSWLVEFLVVPGR